MSESAAGVVWEKIGDVRCPYAGCRNNPAIQRPLNGAPDGRNASILLYLLFYPREIGHGKVKIAAAHAKAAGEAGQVLAADIH